MDIIREFIWLLLQFYVLYDSILVKSGRIDEVYEWPRYMKHHSCPAGP